MGKKQIKEKEKPASTLNEKDQAIKDAIIHRLVYMFERGLRKEKERADFIYSVTKGKKVIINYTQADLDKLERMPRVQEYLIGN